MNNKIAFVLFLLTFVTIFSLYSYQDKDIIRIRLKQAGNFEKQKKFLLAETMYKELLTQFPHNKEVIQKLSSLYLSQKEFETLQRLLNNETNYLSPEFISLTQIEMYIKMNELSDAKNEIERLIGQNKENYILYNKIALIYSRNSHFNEALELYKSARKLSKNPKLYTTEMAMLYQYQMDFQMAIEEYINMLDKRSYNFVKYRLEKLGISNAEVIKALNKKVNNSKNNLVKSLLAEFLLRNNDYEQAFEIFKDLGTDDLLRFAEYCEKHGLFTLCIRIYKTILTNTSNIRLQLTIYDRIGDLYSKIHEYDSAYNAYTQITKMYKNIKGNISQDILMNAFTNLAKLEFSENNDTEKAQKYILQAKKIAIKPEDKLDLSILLADCYLCNNYYKKAIEIYNNILNNQNYHSSITSLAKYKLFLVYIYTKEYSKSDSVLQDYVLHNEKDTYLNDMVSLNKLIQLAKDKFSYSDSLKLEDDISCFIKSLETSNIRKSKYYYEKLTASYNDTILINYIKTKMADFYFSKLQFENSLNIFLELSDNNGIYSDYIEKRIGDCYLNLQDYGLAIESYKKYLINFPNGSFAPEVRKLLKEIES
ncbi:MAG: hypothetical protein U9R23_00955 [Candidatus Cloacimonadota bacterium]|nr:hypothetical protein [Candidatus Cloacimonadota bacterium]